MEVGVDDESSSDTVLVLGIGCAANTTDRHRRPPDSMKSQPLIPRLPGPSLTLGPYADSALSASFSNVKKETDGGFQDSEESGSRRKKLRLSKDQSSLLENRFKEHTTLNPKQKSALAKQLNLRPRQVEVWFQNRRARTKLKQTEVDCEFLRRCCEALTDENRRLTRELQELKALKMAASAPPLYTRLPAATLSVCPSCERVAAGAAGCGSKAAAALSAASAVGPESGKALFFNSFGHKAAFKNQWN